jgi:Tol biopolymer transport system component
VAARRRTARCLDDPHPGATSPTRNRSIVVDFAPLGRVGADGEGVETPIAPRWLRRGVRAVASVAGIAVLAGALQIVTGPSPASAAPLAAAQTFTNPGLAAGNPRFVDAAVRDLLGRPSTSADRTRWVPALDAGQSQAAFASTVTRTPEWASVVVTDLYAQVFGRTPDPGGLTYWSAQLAGGTPTAFLAGLLYGSPEFFTSAGATNPGYVDALYLNILRRLPDPGGRAYWIAQLDGGSDRPALARSLFLAIESNGRRVDGMYQRLLGRAPDTGGRAYWATVLITNDDLQLAALLVGSAEYFTAAQTRFESATLTTVAGTVVLSGAQVTALAVNSIGTGSVTSAAGAPVPTLGRHVVVSRGTANGFAVGEVTAVAARPDGTTVTTFRSAGLADAFAKADVIVTTELPRSGATAVVGPAAGGWTCTAGADTLDVSTRFTADAGLDARLAFDVATGTYTARAIATVTTGFTANLEAAAATSGCDWPGGLWNAGWSALIPAGPIAIPLRTTLDGTFDLDAGFSARFSSSSTASVACRVGFTASATVPPTRQAGCDAPVSSGGGSVLAPGAAAAVASLVVDVRLGSAHTGLAMHGTLTESITTATDTGVRPWWWIELGVDAGGSGDVMLGRWTRTGTWPAANVLRHRLAQAVPDAVPPGPAPLSVTSTSLPPGVVGRPYAATLTAAGGVAPYRWSVTGLPAGLTGSGGGISGEPAGVGITAVVVTVTDAVDRSATGRLDVVVDPATAMSSTITRVTSGVGEAGRSYDQAISRDGGTVAFASDATNLVVGDTNGATDVFTWERATGRIVRITNGRDPSSAPTVSADGRFVAYWSGPAAFVPGNGAGNVYVWDRSTGTTGLVAGGNGWSGQPSISGDGRYVAFTSQATDLVAGDSNAVADVFLRDRTAATTVRLTNGNGRSSAPAISNDGRFVGYLSTATNLVAGGPADPIGTNDVFVWVRGSGSRRVTTGIDSLDPTISDNGRFVAFSSESGALVVGDTNDQRDVFVADRSNATVDRIVLGAGGSEYPSISGDGRIVAFASAALNQNAHDLSEFADIFLWTRSYGTVTRVVQGNGRSIAPRISGDGQQVAFLSAATSLAWLEYNGHSDDVFLVG